MAFPEETTDPDDEPWTDFAAVAERENTYVTVSSLPRSAASAFPYPNLHGYVRNLLDRFGPERLVLGSDYPWMDDWADYGDCLRWVETVDWLSARGRLVPAVPDLSAVARAVRLTSPRSDGAGYPS